MRAITLAALCSGAAGRVTQWPNTGICLGGCPGCHRYLDGLIQQDAPRYLTHSQVPMWKIGEFVTSSEVCAFEKLFPLSVDLNAYSLATLSPETLTFDHAAAQVRATLQACHAINNASAAVLGSALDAAAARLLSASPRPRPSAEPLLALLEHVQRVPSTAVANRTGAVLARHLRAATDLLLEAQSLGDYADLAGVAVGLARRARLLMENARLSLAIKNVLVEISQLYPLNVETLPVYVWHDTYGRHWDVLEARLQELQDAKPEGAALRMLEIGVACGPIGRFLLSRFPRLQYWGVDPTIRDEVFDEYTEFVDRSTLLRNTSEEVTDLFPDFFFDLVFVDGPHTYKNVRNDIELYTQKVRPDGYLAGHDFTSGHPPLLWAVSEQRLNNAMHVAMDGVWWWSVR